MKPCILNFYFRENTNLYRELIKVNILVQVWYIYSDVQVVQHYIKRLYNRSRRLYRVGRDIKSYSALYN